MSDAVHPMHRRALLRAAAALAAAPCLARGAPAERAEPLALQPVRPIVWREFLGVNAQFQWFPDPVARKQVERLKALGLQWVRLGLHWMLIEPEQGRFQFESTDRMMRLVRDAGLRNVTYLVGSPRYASSVPRGDAHERFFDKFPPRSPALFAQRLAQFAQRYPQVDVWQVWNEPNLVGFWAPQPDPEAYSRLFAPASQALRTAAPDKPVALAGMAYFGEMDRRGGMMLQELARLGALAFNPIVAYHPYTAGEEGLAQEGHDFVRRVTASHQWLRNAGVRQVWATEWGWSSYPGPKDEQTIVGEDGQADLTLRRLALMAALDYDRVFLFTLADLDERATRRHQHYGLLRRNGEPKPVYHALQRFLQLCGPSLQPASPPPVVGLAPDGLITIGWRRANGRPLWMLWAREPGEVRLKGVTQATLHQPLSGGERVLRDAGEGVRVPVTTALQIVLGA